MHSPRYTNNIIFWLSAILNMISLWCIVKSIFRIVGKSTVVLYNIYDNNPFFSLRLARRPT